MLKALGLGAIGGSAEPAGPLGLGAIGGPAEPTGQESSHSGGGSWEVNLGPLYFGSAGVGLKPQLLWGVQTSNFKAEAGLGDVRDGLQVSAEAEANVTAIAQGKTVHELHESIQCQTPGFREALSTAKSLLSEGSDVLVQTAQTLGLELALLEDSLAGVPSASGEGTMHLQVTAAVALGASAKVCLGWEDTKGFRMVGIGGQAGAAVSVGASIFAGMHSSGDSAKILVGVSNFKFDYTIPIPQKKVQTEQESTIASAVDEFES